ncbi:MAG: helix-turn-helix domain-containing protein [Betaproteobacteria bacterium]|nr:helix-turn-helix domain-containing protein [Betaproteobacteria bacterium]
MNEAVSALESVSTPPPPGRMLAAARENCGLSVADVARHLKLSASQVEALEADNYQRLPGTVFVRGFIRNYARLVKLDPAQLLASAEPQLPPAAQPAPELPHSADIPFPTGRELRWYKYAIAGLVLLVPVVIYEFYHDEAPSEVTVKSRQVELPRPQVVAEEKVAQAGVVPQAAADSDAAAKSARNTAIAAARIEKTAAQDPMVVARAASVEHQPGEHLVRLRFDRESWVEIRDRNGRRIFSQLNPAGTEQAVSGQPPLTLVVGNAAGVRLIYNDQPVDLAPHIKVDVARLTLE